MRFQGSISAHGLPISDSGPPDRAPDLPLPGHMSWLDRKTTCDSREILTMTCDKNGSDRGLSSHDAYRPQAVFGGAITDSYFRQEATAFEIDREPLVAR